MKLLAPIKNDEDIVNKKYVDTAADKLQSQVNNKADKEHNHDDRYYTESEVDSKVSGINKTISDHISNTSNPHGVTKSQVGLGNVENKSSATIRGEITKSNVTTALGYTPLDQSLKGSAKGLAELDSNGKVPSSQLPSFVDDVVEGYLSGGKFYKESAHTTEISGETGKIYIDLSTEKTYRWSGSAFVVISETLALGETSSTAYRGDKGKVAYDHSQSTHARTDATKVEKSSTNGNIKINGTETTVYKHPSGTNPHGTTKSDVGLGNVGNFKAVSTVASQGLSDTEKSNARANIGAAASSHTHSYAGSSSVGGSATSAIKLDSSAGSATQPVYFSDGKPVSCTYTLGKSVPSDAVFTDTKVTSVYNNPLPSDPQTTGYLTWVTGATTSGVSINNGIRYATLEGTDSTNGYGIFILGNNIASGNKGNKYGAIRLYGAGSYYGQIAQIDGSDNVKHALPATSGTILNTGTTSFTQSLTSGTAIGTLKINNKSTTLYAPTNTDTKVTSVGNHYSPSADSSAALSASASGATAAWSIDVVKGVTLQRDAKGHVTGISVTSGKIPANPNTDTKVTQTATTSNASYPLLLAPNGQTATATTTAYFDSGVTLNPSTNTIAANISGSSASCTGNAATATKLTTSAGSATQPVYFSDGKPVSCTYTLGKSVPSDAVFTDTKVTNTLATTTKAYITGTTTATTNTSTQVFDTGVYLDNKAGNLTATQFNGKLNGNATSATKATQDSSGQQINTTYIKDVSISGTNLSYTKGDSTVTTTTVNDILSGSALTSNSTTATTTKGYSYGVAGVTTSPYNYTKWYAYLDSGITTLTNGMIIKMRIPVAGCNYGTCIAINGSDFHPVVFNTNSVVTTHYGVGVELLLMYDSNGSAKVYSNSATSAAISGVWRVMNNYNSNTTNTAGSTNTSSKIFLVGTTSQTTYAQTYSNSKVYVGTDSCLYSNGKKVSVEGHTHAYLPLTGGNMTGNINIKSNTTNCVILGQHTPSGSGDVPYGYIYLYNSGSLAGNITGMNDGGLKIRSGTNNTGLIGDSSHYFDSAYINNFDKVTMIKGSGDTYHRAERTDLTFTDSKGDKQHEDIRFGISAAGNRGIWDRRLDKWLVRSDTSGNAYFGDPAYAAKTTIRGRAIMRIAGTANTNINISERNHALILVNASFNFNKNSSSSSYSASTMAFAYINNTKPSSNLNGQTVFSSSDLVCIYSLTKEGVINLSGNFDHCDILLFD